MKKAIMIFCIAALLPAAASADIIGTWNTDVSGDYNLYTLNVSSTAGEVMYGFDIKVESSEPGFAYYQDMMSGDKMVFNSNTGLLFTYFLLNKGELNVVDGDTDVTTTSLSSAFAYQAGGLYDAGWTDLDLLKIAVLSSSGITPENFTLSNAISTGVAVATVGASATKVPIQMDEIPEPSTLALLACGLAGLLAYALRKRK